MKSNKIEHVKGRIFLIFAFTLAGTSVIAARFVSNRLGTFTITAISLLFAVAFLAPFCARKLLRSIWQLNKKEWLVLFFQALFGIFLFRIFLLQGLLRTSASEAGVLIGVTPAITSLLAMIVLKEPINKKIIVGILSTMGGILLIQGILIEGNEFSLEHLFGNILILCAASSESLFNIFSRMNHIKTIKQDNIRLDPIIQTILVSVVALILCIIPIFFENPINSLMALRFNEWISLLWYGVMVTALAFIFWYAGIKRCSAYEAAAFSGMMPFTSLVLSVIVLGEYVGYERWAGCVLIVIGMLLIANKENKKLLTTKGQNTITIETNDSSTY